MQFIYFIKWLAKNQQESFSRNAKKVKEFVINFIPVAQFLSGIMLAIMAIMVIIGYTLSNDLDMNLSRVYTVASVLLLFNFVLHIFLKYHEYVQDKINLVDQLSKQYPNND